MPTFNQAANLPTSFSPDPRPPKRVPSQTLQRGGTNFSILKHLLFVFYSFKVTLCFHIIRSDMKSAKKVWTHQKYDLKIDLYLLSFMINIILSVILL